MGIFNDIIRAINPPTPTLAQLARGTCSLPMPAPKVEQVKKARPVDSYVENEATKTFGFNVTTSTAQRDGSAPNLTGYDKRLLHERGYWGGKVVAIKNESAKQCWHSGKTEKEAAVIVGVSISWTEKRYGTFATALSMEANEAPVL